jgi:hypothetical protein
MASAYGEFVQNDTERPHMKLNWVPGRSLCKASGAVVVASSDMLNIVGCAQLKHRRLNKQTNKQTIKQKHM